LYRIAKKEYHFLVRHYKSKGTHGKNIAAKIENIKKSALNKTLDQFYRLKTLEQRVKLHGYYIKLALNRIKIRSIRFFSKKKHIADCRSKN